MSRVSPPEIGDDRVDLDRITIGPFRLTDAPGGELIAAVTERTLNRDEATTPVVLFSLHVGGLNLRNRPEFTAALSKADFLVPDGISVAALARLAGASGLHRHPTTDIGWDLLASLAHRLERPVRVALLGGPAGLADRAGTVMAQREDIEVVLTEHGYHSDWSEPLKRLGETEWDVLIVGMGMPTEAMWVDGHLHELRGALVVTCGGWFGHIVGDERRAPSWMRRAGLEWVARLVQQPARLAGRYAAGLLSTAGMIPAALRSRAARSRTER